MCVIFPPPIRREHRPKGPGGEDWEGEREYKGCISNLCHHTEVWYYPEGRSICHYCTTIFQSCLNKLFKIFFPKVSLYDLILLGGRPLIPVITVLLSRLDVEGIKYVINFDYPNSSQDYIHRIGRTGRCDSTGTSYAFFTPSNFKHARELVSVLTEANQVGGIHFPPLPTSLRTFFFCTERQPKIGRDGFSRW